MKKKIIKLIKNIKTYIWSLWIIGMFLMFPWLVDSKFLIMMIVGLVILLIATAGLIFEYTIKKDKKKIINKK